MFGAPVQSGLTFTKVLSGISKTLSVANQVIPLYREAKPMINNAKTILAVLKDMNKKDYNKETVRKNESTKKEPQKIISNRSSVNTPQFFL